MGSFQNYVQNVFIWNNCMSFNITSTFNIWIWTRTLFGGYLVELRKVLLNDENQHLFSWLLTQFKLFFYDCLRRFKIFSWRNCKIWDIFLQSIDEIFLCSFSTIIQGDSAIFSMTHCNFRYLFSADHFMELMFFSSRNSWNGTNASKENNLWSNYLQKHESFMVNTR